jgi:hypothetical protein
MRLAAPHARLQRSIAVAIAGLLAVIGVVTAPAPASADPLVTLIYPVTGTTHLAGPDNDLALGPGSMASTVDLADGALTGELTLPPATGTFEVIGLVPVTATTEFIPVGPTTGTVERVGGAITATSRVTLRLTSVKVLGLPLLIGDHCQTETPATITVTSQAGWNPAAGGTLAGTYTIPPFKNCLLNEVLFNLIIPGSGNTITLTLGRPTLG